MNHAIFQLGRGGSFRPFVYFALVGTGVIKIGTTRNLGPRLELLARSEQQPVEVLGVMPGGVAVERETHQRFVAHRIRMREWFADCAEIRAFVATLPVEDRPVGLVQSVPGRATKARSPDSTIAERQAAWDAKQLRHRVRHGHLQADYVRDCALCDLERRRAKTLRETLSARRAERDRIAAAALDAARSTPSLGAC